MSSTKKAYKPQRFKSLVEFRIVTGPEFLNPLFINTIVCSLEPLNP